MHDVIYETDHVRTRFRLFFSRATGHDFTSLHLFVDNLTILLITQVAYNRMIRRLINREFEKMWKEAVVAKWKTLAYPFTCV
jgi:hypothetical protein